MDDKRQAGRARSLLAAALHCGGVTQNATVRNLSQSGAMVDVQQPPPVGTSVSLRRGDLAVSATIVWTSGGECGLHFDAPIMLSQWLPQATSVGQERVDFDVSRVRAGLPAGEVPVPGQAGTRDTLNHRLAEELEHVARLLEGLGDELAEDVTITARHGRALQNLDIATQTLGHVGAVIRSSDPRSAIAEIGMEELRRRLVRKSL
jgi:PilZ domain